LQVVFFGAGFGLARGRVKVQVCTQSYYLAHLSRNGLLNLPEPGHNFVLGFVVPIEAGW